MRNFRPIRSGSIVPGGGLSRLFCLLFLVAGASAQSLSSPRAVPVRPVDPQATAETQKLWQDLINGYGHRTWSGQQDTNDLAFIQKLTGCQPLIVAADFMDYSPSRVERGSRPGITTEAMIALARDGQVVEYSWHWNAPTNLLDTSEHPWWRGFYTDATTFDVAAALAHTNSIEYALILRDIDAIAAQLKLLSDAKVPVLWRPLHEAEGRWFWWGARGPEPFKKLWRLLFKRLTGYHGLHNLIWVMSNENPQWYPGGDVVDVIGVDAYPKDKGDLLASRWKPLLIRFNGSKPIALTEFGGVPDIEAMHRSGIWWSWFLSWRDWTTETGPLAMPTNTVIRTYQSSNVVRRLEVRVPSEP